MQQAKNQSGDRKDWQRRYGEHHEIDLQWSGCQKWANDPTNDINELSQSRKRCHTPGKRNSGKGKGERDNLESTNKTHWSGTVNKIEWRREREGEKWRSEMTEWSDERNKRADSIAEVVPYTFKNRNRMNRENAMKEWGEGKKENNDEASNNEALLEKNVRWRSQILTSFPVIFCPNKFSTWALPPSIHTYMNVSQSHELRITAFDLPREHIHTKRSNERHGEVNTSKRIVVLKRNTWGEVKRRTRKNADSTAWSKRFASLRAQRCISNGMNS